MRFVVVDGDAGIVGDNERPTPMVVFQDVFLVAVFACFLAGEVVGGVSAIGEVGIGVQFLAATEGSAKVRLAVSLVHLVIKKGPTDDDGAIVDIECKGAGLVEPEANGTVDERTTSPG